MLNQYHIQFLRNLHDYRVRFLIIGGQARWLHRKIPTRDLDIWVDISEANKPMLETSLINWKRRYPSHTHDPMQAPLPLRSKVQIKFPDTDCWFQTDDGKLVEIMCSDGIDILTSIEGLDFDECFKRSFAHEVNEREVHFLSEEDLNKSFDLKR